MERMTQLLKQYRYGILVLVIGVGLMFLPTGGSTEEVVPTVETEEAGNLQESLEIILSQIQGAGKVKVLLTQAAGEVTIYQQDSDQSGDSLGKDTVVITDGERAEQGLVRQVIPPEYLGAIIVCQGGDSATVRLAITEAVTSVTGLTADKITVLKMK